MVEVHLINKEIHYSDEFYMDPDGGFIVIESDSEVIWFPQSQVHKIIRQKNPAH